MSLEIEIDRLMLRKALMVSVEIKSAIACRDWHLSPPPPLINILVTNCLHHLQQLDRLFGIQ